mmetsp:Transcript_20065/g.28100  ORF Transcript_20065/g.28100 Transcript_20065/m.28100 type:complete len:149 (-) Transcript_20065:41-487(-)
MEWPLDNPNQFAHSQSIGQINATFLSQAEDTSGDDSQGVTLIMNGGVWTTIINFICDPSSEIGHPSYVNRPTSSSIALNWKSKYGCASENPQPAKSQVYCDCAGADISLCMNTACPKDTQVFCRTECLRFGGLGTSQKNLCLDDITDC